jgi:hypothetical protein
MKQLQEYLRWDFPLPRVHAGIELGNGVLGLSVWGDECLHLTIGRTGFWDHRGATSFARSITYSHLRELLGAGREAEVRVLAKPGATLLRTAPRADQVRSRRTLELLFPRGFASCQCRIGRPAEYLRCTCCTRWRETQITIAVAVTEDAQCSPKSPG